MFPTLLDAILEAQGLPREAQEAPQTSKIEPKTRKNRSLKTIRFWHRFWKGLDVVLEGFLVGFLNEKRVKTAKT